MVAEDLPKHFPAIAAVAFGASAAMLGFGMLWLPGAATDSQPRLLLSAASDMAPYAALLFGLPATVWGGLAGRALARHPRPTRDAFSLAGTLVGAATGAGPFVALTLWATLSSDLDLSDALFSAGLGLVLGAIAAAFGVCVGLALWIAVKAR